MALSVVVNGHLKTFETLVEGASLQDLVALLELKTDRVALERNGEIVHRGSRAQVLLANGDRVEIVHFVGGGC